MPKRLSIELHLSIDELEKRYRGAKAPVERTHYQIIWLLAQGYSSAEVAEVTGYSRSWIYEWVWGYNRIGPETLGDGRRPNFCEYVSLNHSRSALTLEDAYSHLHCYR
ncbi:helix-turn-helix domain-containing protein [Microcoleus vaginatus GB1-A2]|uniref:helix-turn-helix domain-containing protein n=1 Tax=Microcoleus vaginatus TaxID=119532 RepID=UPI0032A9AA0D